MAIDGGGSGGLERRRLICRQCRQSAVNRPRGLCWSCYYTPGVKELYPSASKFARRGVGNDPGDRPPPPVPKSAPAGSEEKIAVLGRRAEAGQSLWHPADNPAVAEKPRDRPPNTSDPGRESEA